MSWPLTWSKFSKCNKGTYGIEQFWNQSLLPFQKLLDLWKMTKHFTKDAFVRLEAQMNEKKRKDESSDTDSLPEINQEIICSICLEEVLTEYLWLSCGHCFHRRCIVNWKKKKQNCPNCRSVQQYNCTLIRFLFTGKIAESFHKKNQWENYCFHSCTGFCWNECHSPPLCFLRFLFVHNIYMTCFLPCHIIRWISWNVSWKAI